MRIAVVAGGWHWPAHFYWQMAMQRLSADLFVVAHRNPELQIVREEKRAILANAPGPLGALDRVLYSAYPDIAELRACGWHYQEAANTCGDWCFLNQWLETHDYRAYDVILSCHDDTYLRRLDLFDQLEGDWLMLANGANSIEPSDYVRGSFELWKRELLDLLGGKVPLGEVMLTREGLTDSPKKREELQPWNDTCFPLRRFLVANGLAHRIARLSPHYRVSPWVIEGERGFLHYQASAPEWWMEPGLHAYPIEAAA